jgi:hypothetical protein
MDSTILGVIIGAVLSWPIQLLGMFREERQWQRQQQAEEQKRLAETFKADREHLREAYQNATRALSLMIELNSENSGVRATDAEVVQFRDETYKSLAELDIWLNAPGTPNYVNGGWFRQILDQFLSNPQDEALVLRKVIGYVLQSDERLVQQSPKADSKPTRSIAKGDFEPRQITVVIDTDFRQQEFIRGHELPELYTFDCDLSELTPSQRRKILEINSEVYNQPPDFTLAPTSFTLKLTASSAGGNAWKARLNPTKASRKKLFAAWEADYDRHQIEIVQTKEKQIQQAQ